MIRKWKPAPPDPGITPGGIRDRALQGVLARGQQPEDKEKTRRSQEYWAKYRAERVKRTGTAHQPHDPSEINHQPTKADREVDGMRRREAWAVREGVSGYEEDEVDEEMTPPSARDTRPELRRMSVLVAEFPTEHGAFAAAYAALMEERTS